MSYARDNRKKNLKKRSIIMRTRGGQYHYVGEMPKVDSEQYRDKQTGIYWCDTLTAQAINDSRKVTP